MKKDFSNGERGLLSVQLFHIIIKGKLIYSVPPLPACTKAMAMLPAATIARPLALPAASTPTMSTK